MKVWALRRFTVVGPVLTPLKNMKKLCLVLISVIYWLCVPSEISKFSMSEESVSFVYFRNIFLCGCGEKVKKIGNKFLDTEQKVWRIRKSFFIQNKMLFSFSSPLTDNVKSDLRKL